MNEENLRRWDGWWKVANREQLLTFVIIGLLTLIGLSVLVDSVLGEGTYGDPGSIDFIKEVAIALGEQIGVWFEYFFYIAAFAILFSTNIGIVDYVSRLTADSLKTGYLARSEFWSESKLYFVAAWIICIGGSIIFWSGIEALWLLVIASSGGGVVVPLLGDAHLAQRRPPDSGRLNVRRLRSALDVPGLLIRQRRPDGTTVAGPARISG